MIHTNIIKLKPDFLDEQAREEIKPKFLNKHGKKKVNKSVICIDSCIQWNADVSFSTQ